MELQVEELKAELMDRDLELRLLNSRCRSLESQVREIHASRSWRLTAPVRAISRMLKASIASHLRRPSAEKGNFSESLVVPVAPGLPETIPDEDRFVLYRIIGNDLHPRHKRGQSLDNLRFILDHEPSLVDCEKRFVLNRIVDEDQENEIISLLRSRGCPYIRISFNPEEYRAIGLDAGVVRELSSWRPSSRESLDADARVRFAMAVCRHKNNYVMNANGARNAALADGRSRGRWILPWDGNCFLTEDAWDEIRSDIAKEPDKKYFVVPMARMLSNEPLLRGEIPEATEEPQIVFRADAAEQFNPLFFYGHRDKVELFWRLGVRGAWTEYHDDPWDPGRSQISSDSSLVGQAGRVARLFSGRSALENDTDHARLHRGLARSMAVISTLQRLDKALDVPESRGAAKSMQAEERCASINRRDR